VSSSSFSSYCAPRPNLLEMNLSPATLQLAERKTATHTASASISEPISSFFANKSKSPLTSRTKPSCISLRAGKTVMHRPTAKSCKSRPKHGKCLTKISISRVLFLTFACPKKENRPMHVVASYSPVTIPCAKSIS